MDFMKSRAFGAADGGRAEETGEGGRMEKPRRVFAAEVILAVGLFLVFLLWLGETRRDPGSLFWIALHGFVLYKLSKGRSWARWCVLGLSLVWTAVPVVAVFQAPNPGGYDFFMLAAAVAGAALMFCLLLNGRARAWFRYMKATEYGTRPPFEESGTGGAPDGADEKRPYEDLRVAPEGARERRNDEDLR